MLGWCQGASGVTRTCACGREEFGKGGNPVMWGGGHWGEEAAASSTDGGLDRGRTTCVSACACEPAHVSTQ